MKVVIAEKPSVARDIARVLGASQSKDGYMEGNGYQVSWAFGHLIEFKEPQEKWTKESLPLLPSLELQAKKGVSKQIKILKTLFKEADELICATDAGREGELIFRYIYYFLKSKKSVKRLWISSLTDQAINHGFVTLKPGTEYDNLYYAAKARSESDWYVGINATRALTLTINSGEVYSLGRVQTPTLAMICQRYVEHTDFVSIAFWKLVLATESKGIRFQSTSENYVNQEDADRLLEELSCCHAATVHAVERKKITEQPPLLFDLTGLQKRASKSYSITPDRTLAVAQSLYEKKYITYPRTGSSYISDDVFDTIPELIQKCKGYTQANTIFFVKEQRLSKNSVNVAKVTDHHALLPTGIEPKGLSDEENTIYTMITERMYEAFHRPCEKESVIITLRAEQTFFQSKGSVIHYAGWREVCGHRPTTQEEDENDSAFQTLPIVEEEALPIIQLEKKEGKTKPKPLHSDASLLAFMETAGKECKDPQEREALKDCGLGTPATRDAIIKNLIDRKYVVREKKKIIPTEKGMNTYNIIKNNIIASASLTGGWEKKLESVSKGELSYEHFMNEIKNYTKTLTKDLLELEIKKTMIMSTENTTTAVCPKCGKQLKIFAKGIGCEKECGFVVWKEVCKKVLTNEQMEAIIKGELVQVKGFTSKAGKPFDAGLKLNQEFKSEFVFDNQKN